MSEIFAPFPQFTDEDGNPLDDGYVYIGTVGLDAQTNQIPAFWDSALTQPAAQPLRTSGGYIMYQGAPSDVFVSAVSWSIKVLDKHRRLVFENRYNYAPDGSNIGFIQAGTGAVPRTAQDKMRESVSVKDFGAVGDGITDDTAAIQKAIDSHAPMSGRFPERGIELFFPRGTYLLNSTVRTPSGIEWRGEGAGSIIKRGAATGALVQLVPIDASGVYMFGGLHDLKFEATGDVWAIKGIATNVLNSSFENLWFDCAYAADFSGSLSSYAQGCIFSKWFSHGPLETFINLYGNFNLLEMFDKEGGTGTAVGSYVTLTNSDGNVLRQMLLEGAGHANKGMIKLNDCEGTVIDGYWFEANASNGYALEIDNCRFTKIRGHLHINPFQYAKIRLINASTLTIECLNASAEDLNWQSYFTIDASSYCHVDEVITRRNTSTIDADAQNLTFDRVNITNLLATPVPGLTPVITPDYTAGANLLVNGSFEAGMYAWSFTPAPTGTPAFTPSEFNSGLQFELASPSSYQLYQSIMINPGQVGRPVTLRYVAELTGTGFLVPVLPDFTNTAYNRVMAGDGPRVIEVTYCPTASGLKNFGVWLVGVSGSATLKLDDVTVAFGSKAVANPAKFGSIELRDKTVTYATAIPTNGTWKVGDRIFNSAPAVAQPKGWICTVAGTPGTWVSEGNL